jgi:F-type H+-transporting ATPase subunit delta
MAELATVARPYAEAAFSTAVAASAAPAWSEFLDAVGDVADNAEMHAVTRDPRIPAAQKAELLAAAVGAPASGGTTQFLVVLAENDRLDIVGEVARQFRVLRAAHEGSARAEIESAFPLAGASLDTLVAALAKRFGKRIEPVVEVNSALIGGVTVRIGDEVIDASVRGKLAQMDVALRH